MADGFTIVSTTIGLRLGIVLRWLAVFGWVVAVVLLLTVDRRIDERVDAPTLLGDASAGTSRVTSGRPPMRNSRRHEPTLAPPAHFEQPLGHGLHGRSHRIPPT